MRKKPSPPSPPSFPTPYSWERFLPNAFGGQFIHFTHWQGNWGQGLGKGNLSEPMHNPFHKQQLDSKADHWRCNHFNSQRRVVTREAHTSRITIDDTGHIWQFNGTVHFRQFHSTFHNWQFTNALNLNTHTTPFSSTFEADNSKKFEELFLVYQDDHLFDMVSKTGMITLRSPWRQGWCWNAPLYRDL